MDLGLRDRVVVLAARDAADRDACSAALTAEGARVVLVDDLTAAAAAVDDVVREGRLDAVVALVPRTRGREVLGADLADLYTSWAQVESVIAAFRAAAPAMAERGWGRLLSVLPSSVKWLADDIDELATLTGLGLLGMHKAAVADLARLGVCVNAVLRHAECDADELAATVTFLVSEPAGYLQGVTVSLDGALSPAVF